MSSHGGGSRELILTRSKNHVTIHIHSNNEQSWQAQRLDSFNVKMFVCELVKYTIPITLLTIIIKKILKNIPTESFKLPLDWPPYSVLRNNSNWCCHPLYKAVCPHRRVEQPSFPEDAWSRGSSENAKTRNKNWLERSFKNRFIDIFRPNWHFL